MAAVELTLSIRWETRNQLPRGTACLQAKNTVVSLSLWVRLRIIKKKICQNPVTNYLRFYQPPPMRWSWQRQPPVSGATLRHLWTRASITVCVCFSAPSHLRWAKPLSKTVPVLHSSGEPIPTWRLGRWAWLCQADILSEDSGFHLLSPKSWFVHWHWDVLVLLNQYISSCFTGRNKYRLKSHKTSLVHLATWFLKGLAPQNLIFC